jgi:hypothetical protein
MGCATLSFEDVCSALYVQKVKREPKEARCQKVKQQKGNRAEWGLAKCLGWDNPRGFTTKDLKLISILRG